MTKNELERINAICAAATPGPWANPGGSVVVDKDGNAVCDCLPRIAGYARAATNALLIATARNLLPELVDEIERLNKDLGELSEENERLAVALKLAQALRADRKSEAEGLRAELESAKIALDHMRFAYANKDGDMPHMFEASALAEASQIIGEWRGLCAENGGAE